MSQNDLRVDGSPPSTGQMPVDVAFLSRQTLADAGLEGEVLRLFDAMARTYLHRLELAESAEAQAAHLHTLKGAAAGIGAFVLSDLARRAEFMVREGGMIAAEEIAEIAFAIESVSQFIALRLDEAA